MTRNAMYHTMNRLSLRSLPNVCNADRESPVVSSEYLATYGLQVLAIVCHMAELHLWHKHKQRSGEERQHPHPRLDLSTPPGTGLEQNVGNHA
jgi:hypothetical protein